jgi:hypothetical protein
MWNKICIELGMQKLTLIVVKIAVVGTLVFLGFTSTSLARSCAGAWRDKLLASITFQTDQPTPRPYGKSDLHQAGQYIGLRSAARKQSTDYREHTDVWTFVDIRSLKETFRVNAPSEHMLMSEHYVAVLAVPGKDRGPVPWNVYSLATGELVTSVFSRVEDIQLVGTELHLRNPKKNLKPNGVKPAEESVVVDLLGIGSD